jgi:syntaxin 8
MALVNVDEDSWLLEFSGLERLSHQIAEQIQERDSRNSSQGDEWIIGEVSDKELIIKLIVEYNKISARIRIQLKQFENELSQLGKKLKTQKGLTSDERERRTRTLENLASKKVQLESRFQNTPGSSSRSQLFDRNQKLFDEDPDDEPMLSTAPIETLKSEQKQILKEQDKGLDNLSQVIVQNISDRDSTWSYWLVIICLFIAIVLVGIL